MNSDQNDTKFSPRDTNDSDSFGNSSSVNIDKHSIFSHIPWPLYIGLPILGLISIIHTLLARPIWDSLNYSSWFAFFMTYVFIILMLDSRYDKKRGEPDNPMPWKELAFTPLVFLFFIATGFLIYSIGVTISDFANWSVTAAFIDHQTIAVTIFITFVFGIFLFYFRLRARCLYGALEVIVGLVVAAQRAATDAFRGGESLNFYLAVLTAGIYLVVRGLDNIHQGWTKYPYDFAARWLLKQLRRPIYQR